MLQSNLSKAKRQLRWKESQPNFENVASPISHVAALSYLSEGYMYFNYKTSNLGKDRQVILVNMPTLMSITLYPGNFFVFKRLYLEAKH